MFCILQPKSVFYGVVNFGSVFSSQNLYLNERSSVFLPGRVGIPAYVGPTSAHQRWANVDLSIGPTVACQRWPNVGTLTLGQRWHNVTPMVVCQRCTNIGPTEAALLFLWGEPIGHWWIHLTKGQERWCWCLPKQSVEQTVELSNRWFETPMWSTPM